MFGLWYIHLQINDAKFVRRPMVLSTYYALGSYKEGKSCCWCTWSMEGSIQPPHINRWIMLCAYIMEQWNWTVLETNRNFCFIFVGNKDLYREVLEKFVFLSHWENKGSIHTYILSQGFIQTHIFSLCFSISDTVMCKKMYKN